MATASASQPPLFRALGGSRLPALDGLRAVAVFVVMVYHFGINAVPGDLGVSAFFVLSGFLITWLLLKEHGATGNVSLRQFYTRRVLRIFPAYYAFIVLTYAGDHLRGQAWPPGLAPSALLYLVNYFNALHGHPTTAIAHAWSLGIEEQFYLLWPLLLLVLLRGGVARVARTLVIMIVVVVAWRCVLLFGLHVDRAYLYNAFDTRFDNLAVGCLLATIAVAPQFQGVAGRLAGSPLAPLATLALLLVSRSGLGATYHYTLGFTVDAVLVAVFIVQMLQLHSSALWSWLESPVARYLGVISYPLYLWHQWGLSAGHHVRVAGPLGELVAGIGLSILLASGSYYVIERPFLALKARFTAATATPAPDRRAAGTVEAPA
jgi:peptidoglycan/LPS O-acetylase OafA/YrhL